MQVNVSFINSPLQNTLYAFITFFTTAIADIEAGVGAPQSCCVVGHTQRHLVKG